MAYLSNYLGDGGINDNVDSGDGLTPQESDVMGKAFTQFSTGDIAGAAATLGPSGLVATGLISTGVGAALGAALAVGLALLKLVGRGRSEADLITPIQNQLINSHGTGQLDQITQMLVHNPSVQGLQALYDQVQRIGSAFIDFVSQPAFKDGRASAQALNTIMPYINGTCGYTWPPPMNPTTQNCIHWGDGTPGGVGTDGMLGAIARAILQQGGTVPPLRITQGYGTTIPTLAPSGSQSYPWLPQTGMIPATAPLSPLRPSIVPTVSAGIGDGLLPALLIGGVAFMLLRK